MTDETKDERVEMEPEDRGGSEETVTSENERRRSVPITTRPHYREQKLPTYSEGMGYKDFEIKYLMTAGTRGRTKEALESKFFGKMPPWIDKERGVRKLSDSQ